MRRQLSMLFLILIALWCRVPAEASAHDEPAALYQLRTYSTAPDKLDILLERFARVNVPIFQKHELTLVGAWTPEPSEASPDRLIYLVSFLGVPRLMRHGAHFWPIPSGSRPLPPRRKSMARLLQELRLSTWLQPTIARLLRLLGQAFRLASHQQRVRRARGMSYMGPTSLKCGDIWQVLGSSPH